MNNRPAAATASLWRKAFVWDAFSNPRTKQAVLP